MKEERNNTNTPKHHKTRNHKTDYNKIINNVITTIYKASNVIPNLAANRSETYPVSRRVHLSQGLL